MSVHEMEQKEEKGGWNLASEADAAVNGRDTFLVSRDRLHRNQLGSLNNRLFAVNGSAQPRCRDRPNALLAD